MILRVNPNRMELLRLRKRLLLARRGHKFLQDKLEELMRRFQGLLKDINKAKEDFQHKTKSLLRNLIYCRITSSKDDFQETLQKIKSEVDIDISTSSIMNVKVPVFAIKSLRIEKNYDFFKTSAQMDLVIAESTSYIESLLKLSQLLKTLDILSYEIERTRRRVNALEYMLIPSINETVHYITQKL
ncbi:MAG: V-type ATP synthase subunit D, partial [Candidatus Omnitrophica bacterium]|nr:V-type ATP synthase subunit D [Candidatus Omnitrophota bacterium]